MNPQPQYVLSGLRPAGRVHLGNYFGAVRNWVRSQDRYPCFFTVADWHALASDYADPSKIRGNPDICNHFQFHELFSDEAAMRRVGHECRTAQIGCVRAAETLAQVREAMMITDPGLQA